MFLVAIFPSVKQDIFNAVGLQPNEPNDNADYAMKEIYVL